MLGLGPLIVLVVLGALVRAFELDANGDTVALDVYRREQPPLPLGKRDSTGTLNVGTTWFAPLYYINFTLGGQSLAAQIDTGSSDFWVPAPGPACAKGCPLGSFDPKQSHTYNVTQSNGFSTSYVDKTAVSGDLGADTFQIGDVTVESITVGVATQGKSDQNITGILGLGFDANQANASHQTYPTLLDLLVNEGKISTHTYSLYLNNIKSQGSLLFGGIDTAKFQGELGIVDMQPNNQGQYRDITLDLTGLSFSNNGQSVNQINLGSSGWVSGTLDSGSSNTVLPNNVAYEIYTGLGLEYSDQGANIPCDANLKGYMLNFTFGGSGGLNLGVPLSNFVLPYDPNAGIPNINGDRGCGFGISPLSTLSPGSDPLFGDTFLRGVYAVFDLDNLQVAMAPAIQNASGSNVIAIAGSSSAIATGVTSAAATGTPSFIGNVSNSIPSATTIQSQTSISLPPAATVSTPPPFSSSAAPTFNGIPSSGFSLLPGAHSGAIGLAPPSWGLIGSLVASVTVVLMALGGGLLVLQ